MKLKEIVTEITKYLKQFEIGQCQLCTAYFNPFAVVAGRYVQITYVSYLGHSSLTKQEALEYLEWLREGNVGKHYSLREELSNYI